MTHGLRRVAPRRTILARAAFVRLERPWVPSGEGFSLYLRPTFISTWPHVGVSASKAFKLFVIACPVGPYYPEGARLSGSSVVWRGSYVGNGGPWPSMG